MNHTKLNVDDDKPKDNGDAKIKTAQSCRMINTLNGKELNADNKEESVSPFPFHIMVFIIIKCGAMAAVFFVLFNCISSLH